MSSAYDGENRQKSLTDSGMTFNYHYDGEGRRVKKVTNAGTTVYVYDAAGQLAAEYSDVTNPESGTQYLTVDHLGSTRLVTNASGAVLHETDYYPFGEETNGGDWFNPKFTAKLRDYESGLNLDYFGARYFAGAMGRFTSADAPLFDQNAADPQSWNLYGYVRNNPLKYVDPDGRAYKVCNEQGDCGVYSDDDYDELRGNESYNVANGKIYSRNEDGTQGDQLGTAGYWGEDLSDLGQGVVGGLAERADASNQMIAGVAVGSAAVGTSAALAPVAGQAVNELALGAAGARLFWSGAKGLAGAKQAAATGQGRLVSSSSLGGARGNAHPLASIPLYNALDGMSSHASGPLAQVARRGYTDRILVKRALLCG